MTIYEFGHRLRRILPEIWKERRKTVPPLVILSRQKMQDRHYYIHEVEDHFPISYMNKVYGDLEHSQETFARKMPKKLD